MAHQFNASWPAGNWTTAHTPGPWHGFKRAHANGYEVVNAKGAIAFVPHTENVPVIAAAPDLLAALRLMVNARTKGFLESWQWEQRINDAVDAARAAIAKAEGGK